ncbi:MAG: SBBP repeat-containing protein [Bryobacteraceae bacterium]
MIRTLSAVLVLWLSAAPFLYGAASESNTVVGVVSYGTYFGGSSYTTVAAIAADSLGNVYVTGWTGSQDLPVTQGSYQAKFPGCPPTSGGCYHAFVAKVGRDGKLLWSTYLGGTTSDVGVGIAVDAAGSVYVAGNTTSKDFPTTPDALERPNGNGGGFVAKLDATGSKLLYSTFIGGGATQSLIALALGSQGTLVVAGSTTSTDFPTVHALQPQFPGGNCGSKYGQSACAHAFFAGWRSSDMKVLFASYLGGTGVDAARGTAVDAAGDIYLTGSTNSPDFPLRNALQVAAGAGNCPDSFVAHYPTVCSDAFVTKISPDGLTLLYSTRLGGALGDSGDAVVLDASGDAMVVGTTASSDFPVVHAAESYPGTGTCPSEDLAGSPAPCPHAFAAKLKPDGSALIYSTYISGKGGDAVSAAATDGAGNLYVGGYTMSDGFPVTNGALRHCNSSYSLHRGSMGGDDGTDFIDGNGTTGFLTELDANGALVFSTYFGGTGNDQVLGLALYGSSGIYLGGSTTSPDLPITAGAMQPQLPDLPPPISTGFLARLSFATGQSLPPQIDAGCVVNGASFQAGAVAPGEIVSLFGSGLGPASGIGAVLAQGRLTTQLAGASVTFDGVPAPLLYVSANQINAIVPFEVAGKSSTQIVATVNGATSIARQQPVVAAAAGVFTVDMTGAGQAVVLNQDGTLNSSTNPAARGSVLTLWLTGLGVLSESYADGQVVTGSLGAVTHDFGINLVTPGQFPLTILYAGQAPDMAAGVVQVNGRIPLGIQPWLTQVNFILHVDGLTGNAPYDEVFANPVTIWLEYLGSG